MSIDVGIYARAYLKAGLSIFPLDPGSKRPLGAERDRAMKWEQYQSARASLNEAETWFQPFHDGRVPNIAIVGGAVSGNLVIVDIDDPEALRAYLAAYPDTLSRTKVARSGKGIHIYYRTEEPMRKGYAIIPGQFDKLHQPLRLGVDLQADKSYVVAPPSLHESGRRYEWINPDVKRIEHTTVADVRGIAERLGGTWTAGTQGTAAGSPLRNPQGHPRGWIRDLLLAGPGMVEGSGRNRSLLSLIGYFRKTLPFDIGYALAELWNNSLAEPMDEHEVQTIVTSGYRYAAQPEPEPNDERFEDLPV